jgi:predicted DNA-binding transcriptional regulator AlpA
MELLTASELENCYDVGNLSELSLDQIAHLSLVAGEILGRRSQYSTFAKWFLNALLTEAKRRQSEGEMELRSFAIPIYQMSEAELFDAMMRADFLSRFDTLSEPEESFCVRVHHSLQIAVHCKLTESTRSGCRLLSRADVADWLGVDDETVTQYVRAGKLPKPCKLSPKTYRWKSIDVQRFIDSL